MDEVIIQKINNCMPPSRLNNKFNLGRVRNWRINRGTGTDEIALESEAKSKLGSSGLATANKYCTKTSAIAFGADSSKLSSYSNEQLVKYSDLAKTKFELSFSLFNISHVGKSVWYRVGMNDTKLTTTNELTIDLTESTMLFLVSDLTSGSFGIKFNMYVGTDTAMGIPGGDESVFADRNCIASLNRFSGYSTYGVGNISGSAWDGSISNVYADTSFASGKGTKFHIRSMYSSGGIIL